jgi:hypothetical protein
VRKWVDAKELASAVVISLTNLIKTKPALGWVRADYLPDDSAAQEMLRLKNENDSLKRAIAAVTVERPDEFDTYEFGEEKVELHFTVQPAGNPSSIPVVESFPWNQLFSVLAPLLFEGASNAELKNRLEDFYRNVRDDRSTVKTNAANIRNHDFEKIKIQFLALRLISRRDNVKPWILTPYGERLLVEIGAERKRP